MGMGASQIRLLSLINWKANNTKTLESLSNDKLEMTREANKLSQDYTNAINSKTLKLSYNNGVTYIDLSYSNLMTYTAGSKKPTFITDINSRIVISDNYKKYAEMISKDGSAGGDWSSIRTQVLAKLTGMSEEELTAYEEGTVTITSEQKSLIAFYDEVFNAIAANGWIYNEQVSDNDYLNETLQNGYFYLTTFEKEETADGGYDMVPDTDLAINNENIFQVNNSSKNDSELAKYEAKKAKLNQKETAIDTRMKNLETEQSAIQGMIETVKNIIDKNVEENMNTFA